MKIRPFITWVFRLLASLIMLQTLWFKFTGAEESVYIFTRLGMEPWGRILTGISELVASVLLLVPALSFYGAILGLGIMSGAIFFHISKLGIVVQDDSGLLFTYAIIVFLSCLALIIILKKKTVS